MFKKMTEFGPDSGGRIKVTKNPIGLVSFSSRTSYNVEYLHASKQLKCVYMIHIKINFALYKLQD